MSIIIKGIDKPKNCVSCRFTYTDDNAVTRCGFCDNEVDIKSDSVLDKCPIEHYKDTISIKVTKSKEYVL